MPVIVLVTDGEPTWVPEANCVAVELGVVVALGVCVPDGDFDRERVRVIVGVTEVVKEGDRVVLAVSEGLMEPVGVVLRVVP